MSQQIPFDLPDSPQALTLNEYQELARVTAGVHKADDALVNWTLGLVGESGEFADKIKKEMFHGHHFPTPELIKELGDILWYVAMAADALGFTLDDVAQMNINKLKDRYPHGFDRMRSIDRKEEKE